jgi:hypothetical protein
MTPLRFNFATAPGLVPARLLGIALSGAAAVGALFYFFIQTQQLRVAESELTVAARSSVATHSPRPSPESERTAKAMAAMQARLALPLPTLLRSLQPAPEIGKGLSVVGLDLASSDGAGQGAPRIRITAHADSLIAAAEYVQHLSRQPMLAEVRMLRHEYLSDRSVAQVQFAIELLWIGHERP